MKFQPLSIEGDVNRTTSVRKKDWLKVGSASPLLQTHSRYTLQIYEKQIFLANLLVLEAYAKPYYVRV